MGKNIKTNLKDLGYDDFFESKKNDLGLSGYVSARVVAEYKEAYRVRSATGEYLAKISGKQIFRATKREDYPAVGDWVVIDELPGKKAVIHKILPRKTILKKQYASKQDAQIIATNVDVAFIVESLDMGYNLNRFERYLVLVKEGKIKPVIVLNKTDLIPKSEIESKVDQIKNRFSGIDVISTSAINNHGLDKIWCCIEKGKTYCFLGSSGVGKSSMINRLLGKDEIKTKEINTFTGRGRHTTSVREIYILQNGGIVIDNPGTREVGIVDSGVGIEIVFDEINKLAKQCKFADCIHVHEPDCAVLKALEEGVLDEEKYNNYLKLKKESDFYRMTDLERKQKDRKFGQFIKKVKDELKDI